MIGTKEFNPEPVEGNADLQDFEDVEETFSFSNLSFENDCDNFSKQDGSSSFDHQDFFEFFSEELTSSSSSTNSSDSIVFCGKLIPYKGETVVAETEQNQLEIKAQPKQNKKSFIFPSKPSLSFSKSTAARSNTTSPKKKKQEKRGKGSTDHKGDGTRKLISAVDGKISDSSMRKGSSLSVPLTKTGCYSFRLGVGKFPMEMDLSDIKMRQSKKSPAPARIFFPSDDESDRTGKSSKGKKEKNLWGLFTGKASLGCIPQV